MWTDEEVQREVRLMQKATLDEITKLEESFHARLTSLLAQVETLGRDLALADDRIDQLKRGLHPAEWGPP